MVEENVKCDNCGRMFKLVEVNGDRLGDRDYQEITCPNCGNVTSRKTTGYFKTEKI
jgi:ssDNA-binding Zn-finger/Zn-ribbon topoisomerase 1